MLYGNNYAASVYNNNDYKLVMERLNRHDNGNIREYRNPTSIELTNLIKLIKQVVLLFLIHKTKILCATEINSRYLLFTIHNASYIGPDALVNDAFSSELLHTLFTVARLWNADYFWMHLNHVDDETRSYMYYNLIKPKWRR